MVLMDTVCPTCLSFYIPLLIYLYIYLDLRFGALRYSQILPYHDRHSYHQDRLPSPGFRFESYSLSVLHSLPLCILSPFRAISHSLTSAPSALPLQAPLISTLLWATLKTCLRPSIHPERLLNRGHLPPNSLYIRPILLTLLALSPSAIPSPSKCRRFHLPF